MSNPDSQLGARLLRRTADRPNALVELTLARFREFVREPEAVFWVFAFPVIMTCALGIAFRSRGAEPVIAGVVEQPGADQIAAALEQTRRLYRAPARRPTDVDRALRDGRVPVVVVPGTPPTYRFDEARAESQVARLAVDAALQRAAGRADAFTPVQQPMQTVGSRYIDWLVPGLLGMNIMGTGHVGRRLRDRQCAHEEAAEAPGRHADEAVALPAVAGAQPPGDARRSKSSSSSVLPGSASTSRCTERCGRWRPLALHRRARVRRPRRCSSPAARARSKRCRG